MRALTVQQPWAWAIIHGGKDVENRRTGIVGTYRGPLAIHTSTRVDQQAFSDDMIKEAFGRYDDGWLLTEQIEQHGAIIGVVDLVNEHPAPPGSRCCGAWAEPGVHHLRLANPRPLAEPILCRGRLGLWFPPAKVLPYLEAAR